MPGSSTTALLDESTYVDPQDAPGSPLDVTSVVLGWQGDDLVMRVRFAQDLPTGAAPESGGMLVSMNTKSSAAAELSYFVMGESLTHFMLRHCATASCSESFDSNSLVSLQTRVDGDTLTIRVPRAALLDPTTILFQVATGEESATGGHTEDTAPDAGRWVFPRPR